MNMELREITERDFNEQAVQAAFRYARREAKGLPPDRWAVSEDEQRLVAEGIRILFGTAETLWAELQARQRDPMTLHSKRE